MEREQRNKNIEFSICKVNKNKKNTQQTPVFFFPSNIAIVCGLFFIPCIKEAGNPV